MANKKLEGGRIPLGLIEKSDSIITHKHNQKLNTYDQSNQN